MENKKPNVDTVLDIIDSIKNYYKVNRIFRPDINVDDKPLLNVYEYVKEYYSDKDRVDIYNILYPEMDNKTAPILRLVSDDCVSLKDITNNVGTEEFCNNCVKFLDALTEHFERIKYAHI